jgi:hypothetical protein
MPLAVAFEANAADLSEAQRGLQLRLKFTDCSSHVCFAQQFLSNVQLLHQAQNVPYNGNFSFLQLVAVV